MKVINSNYFGPQKHGSEWFKCG